MSDTLAALTKFASFPTLKRWAYDPCTPPGVRDAARKRLDDLAEVKRVNGFRFTTWMYDRPKQG